MVLVQSIGAIIGASLASFAATGGYRLASGVSLVRRSACNHCEAVLPWYSLIPVLGYVVGHGKCANCRMFVPVRYPLIEIGAALFFAVVLTRYGLTLQTGKLIWVAMVLIASTESDLLSRRIPNRIIIASIGVLVLFDAVALLSGKFDASHYAWCGIALLSGLSMRVAGIVLFKRPGLGFGDIKLFAILGLFAAGLFPAALFAAIITASLVGLGGIASDRLKRHAHIPFAPFLTVGFLTAILLTELTVL